MQPAMPSCRSHACILSTCAEPCLYPGEHHKDRFTPIVLQEGKSDGFGTWIAAHAELICICKYTSTGTVIYMPSQDAFYFASPSMMLGSDCPDATIFIGQFVVDDDKTPRVLVFDIAKLRGISFTDMPPRERYSTLQGIGPKCLGSMCTLQWVGDCGVLSKELTSGRFKVPHEVRAVAGLTATPGRLVQLNESVGSRPR